MSARIALRIKSGKFAGKTFEFGGRGTCQIGRGPDCEVCLPNEREFTTISRHHCLLIFDPPRVQVLDCCSHNGTYLNDMQIGHPNEWRFPPKVQASPCQAFEVSDGDRLTVGETLFEVKVLEQPQYNSGAGHETLM